MADEDLFAPKKRGREKISTAQNAETAKSATSNVATSNSTSSATQARRGRPNLSAKTETASKGRPKANSQSSAPASKPAKRNWGESGKKAQIVADATENANRANSIARSDLSNSTKGKKPVVQENVENPIIQDLPQENIQSQTIENTPQVELQPEINLENQKGESEFLQDAQQDDTPQNEQSTSDLEVSEPNEDEDGQDELLSNDDLTVDEDEISELEKKSKRKKNTPNDEEGALTSKKKKKKKWWLLLLLLLLLLFGGIIFVFKDILFPPPPIVIVPEGNMVLEGNIKPTDTVEMGKILVKPGDTIEFIRALSIASASTKVNEDGVIEPLSPFSLRLQFYIEDANGIKNYNLISELSKNGNFSDKASFTKFGDWYYWNDIVIPGAPAKELIKSITLNKETGNAWQGQEVKLVLRYQTVIPTEEDINISFEYEYPPEWYILVTSFYEEQLKV